MSFATTMSYTGEINTFGHMLGMIIMNPRNTAQYVDRIDKGFNHWRGWALGSTAKFYRNELKKAFRENTFGWADNPKPANGGGYTLKSILSKNKPRKERKVVSKGSVRKLGGRLGSTMVHEVDDVAGTMEVGTIPRKIPARTQIPGEGWARIMAEFQDAGKVNRSYELESMRKYFGALNIPVSRNPRLERPDRKLFAPMTAKYPPQEIFERKFNEKLAKIRV